MATLTLTILGDAAKAKKAMAETADSAEGMGKTMSGMGTAMAAGAAAGLAGLVALGVGAFQAAEESAKIGRETARVIETTGAAAWTSADQVGELASAISDKTGADDEAIQSGANLLLTFTNIRNEVGAGNDIFDQATGLALDMSTALGTDVAGASVQLGKALNDPLKGITALSKAGVSFTAEQKDQIRVLQESGDILGAQKIVLAELGKEFGGAAEAAGTPLDKLMVKVGNLQEELGGKLIPIVQGVATVLGDTMGPAIEKATGFLSEHGEAIKYLASVGLVGLAAAYGPVVAAQVTLAATSIGRWAFEAAAGFYAFTSSLIATAAAEGVMAAASVALAAAAAPVIVGVAALGGAVYGLISILDRSSESADKFWESTFQDVDTSSFAELDAATGEIDKEINRLTESLKNSGWRDFAASMLDVIVPIHEVKDSTIQQADALHTLRQRKEEETKTTEANESALYAYAQAQVAAATGIGVSADACIDAAGANDQLAGKVAATNAQLHAIAQSKKIEVTEPGAAARVQALYEATQHATTGTLGMSEAAKKYNDAAATAKDKTDAFKQSLDSLIGVHLSAAQAETQMSQNNISLLKTLTENRTNAAGATKAGTDASLANIVAVNANNTAIQGNAKAALDHANSIYQETGSLDAASTALTSHRDGLIKTMEATGYSHDAAVAYVDQLGLTPANIKTAVNLDNADANNKIAGTQGGLNGIAQGAHAVVSADTSPAQRAIDDFFRRNPGFSGPISPGQALDWANRHRATGGPVARGTTYIVGENGPELFTPTSSGYISPTSLRAGSSSTAGGIVEQHFHVNVTTTGLGTDSPKLQRDLVAALRKFQARNGPVLAGAR
jgi:hypothetical protein